MSKNHMAEVAKLFEVELGESFKIKITDGTQDGYPDYFRFTENAGIEMSKDGVTWEMSYAGVLKSLLMGDIRIIKLPMSKDLCNESTKAIRLKNIQSIFGFFAEQIMNKERWETEPANLAAYTAVDVLIDYCLSRDKHCQDCVFNHEANMCELFSRIRQRTNKEMM